MMSAARMRPSALRTGTNSWPAIGVISASMRWQASAADREGLACSLIVSLLGVGEENRLAVGAESGNRLLPFLRNQPLGEALGGFLFDMRMARRVHRNDAIGIEQHRVASQ